MVSLADEPGRKMRPVPALVRQPRCSHGGEAAAGGAATGGTTSSAGGLNFNIDVQKGPTSQYAPPTAPTPILGLNN